MVQSNDSAQQRRRNELYPQNDMVARNKANLEN